MNMCSKKEKKFAVSEKGDELIVCGEIGSEYFMCINKNCDVILYTIKDANFNFLENIDNKVLVSLKNNPENIVRIINSFLENNLFNAVITPYE